jgi:medium-chain acyl-[acyl-carrier-protein] hydrolase
VRKFSETIYVHTWIRKTDGLFSYRDFHILNDKEEIIGAASFTWAVIDLDTRRPQRIDSIVVNFPHFTERQAFSTEVEKLDTLNFNGDLEYFSVKYSDLDINLHVNNVKYIEWAIDAYPPEKFVTSEINQLTINFLAECLYKERVGIISDENSDKSNADLHGIIRQSDKKELCRVKIEWKKMND